MSYEIKVIDNFINECKSSGKEATYDNFAPLNESIDTDVQVSLEIFESYLRYKDVNGSGMVSLMEFEKIKSFSEFVNDKKGSAESEEHEEEETPEEEEKEETEEAPEAETEEAPEEEEEKKDDTMKVEVESVNIDEAEAVTNPEKIATLADTKNDSTHQTAIELKTGNGSATAKKVEDTIVALGKPEDKNEKTGEALVGEASVEVQVQPETVNTVKGEGTDALHNTNVPAVTTDGSATAKKIEDTIVDLGKPEDKNEKTGEVLLGESEAEKKTLN